MEVIIYLCIVMFHSPVVYRFFKQLVAGNIPSTVDFGAMSVVLYFDIGLFLEIILGIPYLHRFLSSVITPEVNYDMLLTIGFIVITAPYMFYIGDFLINHKKTYLKQGQFNELRPQLKYMFYALVLVSSFFLAIRSLLALQTLSWNLLDERIGTNDIFNLLNFLPTCFLAFFVTQKDSKTKFGIFLAIALMLLTIPSGLLSGQRYRILIGPFILLFFYTRVGIRKLALIGVIVVFSATLLKPLMRVAYSKSLLDENLIYNIIFTDFYRVPLQAKILENSDLFGTRLLPYPLEGYLYFFMIPIPRVIVPFKGYSTNNYVTAFITNRTLEDSQWGLGGGAIEELMANGGILFVFPGLIIYGIVMGILDRFTNRLPQLTIAVRMGALWICGYQLTSTFWSFGVMFGVALVCTQIFSVPKAKKEEIFVSQSPPKQPKPMLGMRNPELPRYLPAAQHDLPTGSDPMSAPRT